METNENVCIGSCEIDVYARKTYAKNFGHEPEYRDVREIKPGELPDFDCLCAGFPCQAFSIAGKRRGFEDTRGTLFFEIVRIAREKQPSILFLENVKGLVSHDKGETFRIILETLDELGYDVEWQVINSKYFVPQNRERIFIIGHLRGSGRRKIFPIGESSHFDDQLCKKTQRKRKWIQSPHTRTIDANYWKGGTHGSVIGEPKSIQRCGDRDKKTYSVKDVSHCLNANPMSDYQNKIIEPSIMTGAYAEKKTTMIMNANKSSNCKNRIQERDESWGLTGNSNDFNIMENFRIRKLTPIECERLQGFPDNWTKGVSDTQRYKQLGNAVTTTVVEYIAHAMTNQWK